MWRLFYIIAAFVIAIGVQGNFASSNAALQRAILTIHPDTPITYVHCRRTYHCQWTTRGNTNIRRCHVCP
jgi:hypothetical protein